MRMGKCSLASEVETDHSDSRAMSLKAKLMSGEVERRMQPARGRFARFDLDRQSTQNCNWMHI